VIACNPRKIAERVLGASGSTKIKTTPIGVVFICTFIFGYLKELIIENLYFGLI